MYLARNMDPQVGEPWFGGFDGLCAWVLDRMLHLDGAASAADMKVFLQQACGGRNALKAANDGPLVLPTLGPEGIRGSFGTPGLPLRLARLPTRTGGMAMPHLHQVCKAAFVGQVMTTLCARVVGMHADLRLVPEGAGLPPAAALAAGAAGAMAVGGPAQGLPPLFQALHGTLAQGCRNVVGDVRLPAA